MRKYLFILLVFFSISFISAHGCCVSSGQDRCYSNVEEEVCSAENGNYYANDPTCNSLQSCQMGCCIIGLEASMMTMGKCQLNTRIAGFSALNFMKTTENCDKFVSSQDWGACIAKNSYGETQCSYVPRNQCAGEFRLGILCSGVGNLVCNKTTQSFCYNNDAYYVDTCGNRDALKQSCDYKSGTVCKQTTSINAECKSVDCIDNTNYNSFVVNGSYQTAPKYVGPVTRKQGDVWCVTNGMVPYDEKYFAVNDTKDKTLVEKLFSKIFFNKGDENLTDSAESLIGNRFFSRYCINGEIVTEPCDDLKESYCSGSSSWYDNSSLTGTGGQCEENKWRTCLNSESEDDCDTTDCFWYAPEGCFGNYTEEGKMIKELGIGKCLPKVPGAIADSNSKNSICSQGNYETTLSFWFMAGNEQVVYLKKPDNSSYGNAGLLSESPENWYELQANQLTFSPTTGENLYVSPTGLVPSVYWGLFNYIPLNPEVIAYLDYRCSRIADCSGKVNWVGVEGKEVDSGLFLKDKKEVDNDLQGLSENITALQEARAGDGITGAITGGLIGCTKGPIGCAVGAQQGYSSTSETAYSTSLSLSGVSKNTNVPILYADLSQTAAGGNQNGPINFEFKYECKPSKAPTNGTCEMCSSDGTPCTAYKCTSLGKNCEYKDITSGSNGGKCVEKTDMTGPQIKITCPNSASIKAQEPISIKVSTSEFAQCRFSINDAKAKYDLMTYDLGKIWGNNHETILTVPGMNQLFVGNATQYPLLTSSGKFDVYVRCIDPSENGDAVPATLCSFEVPKTPDRNPPVILKITPESGSSALFNSTKKEISLLVNEFAECKWSLKDQDFATMENRFSCNGNLVLDKDVSGFKCIGELTNVSNKVGNRTAYYIRCKDQPSLEGKEDITYRRNANIRSTVYYLKPSEKLEITELSPNGTMLIGPSANNWTITVRTKGGAESGKTECRWRLNYKDQTMAFSTFMNTESTVHTQTITRRAEGDYSLDVKCVDTAGNTVNSSNLLKIRYDAESPIMSRIFNDKGVLKLFTVEPAICKFTSVLSVALGCSFNLDSANLTLMTGSTSLEHTATWKKGLSYFVKCEDFYGNENSLCGIVAKAV